MTDMDVKTAIRNGDADTLRQLLSDDSSRANELIRWDNKKCLTHPLHFIADMLFNGTLQKGKELPLVRGLVEDVDDFRVTNPPSNPTLLDALAADFSGHRYDLRHIIRAMLNSRTYQLSAEPTESGRADALNYSHYFMRRLTAEEMLDTISEVTGIQEKFRGFPPGTRAMQVYSAQPGGSYMLSAFGRPNRETICERDPMPDIVQTLHLISGDTINKKVADWKPDPALDDAQQLNRIFLSSLSRYPSEPERQRIEADLKTKEPRSVFQDLLWAVLNSKEFMFNH